MGIILYLKGMCWALPTCAQGVTRPDPEGKEKSIGFLLRVKVFLWSVWVLVSHAAGGTPTPNYTQKDKKYRDPRAQEHEYNT